MHEVQPSLKAVNDSISGLMSAGAMGLWHGVEYFEKEKIKEKSDVDLFVNGWDPLLREYTTFRYDWSYIVAWVGVGMCLASASLFAMAGFCIKSDREHEEAMNMQYLMPGTIFHHFKVPLHTVRKTGFFSDLVFVIRLFTKMQYKLKFQRDSNFPANFQEGRQTVFHLLTRSKSA